MSANNNDEILLTEEPDRLTIFPLKFPTIWEQYKAALSAIWTVEEINLSADADDWNSLTDNERYFIRHILAFFSSSDTIVNMNLSERFVNEVKPLEAKMFYNFQQAIENIHCVSGDTKIMTSNGYIEIKEACDKTVSVWNGKEFTDVDVKYTGDSPLIRVELSNGMCLDCTPEHKWFTRDVKDGTRKVTFTKNLSIGEIIHHYDLPVIHSYDLPVIGGQGYVACELRNPYVQGFYSGNGTTSLGQPVVVLKGEQKSLMKFFDEKSSWYSANTNSHGVYVTNKIDRSQAFVPINYPIETRLSWLAGLIDASGEVFADGLDIAVRDEVFARELQLFLTTLGIQSYIQENPLNDNFKKPYKCHIAIQDVFSLVGLGLKTHHVILENHSNSFDNIVSKGLSVIGLRMLDGIHRTYCFCEPKEHAGIFNGILTGQSETYSLLIDTYIKDKKEKMETFNAIQYIPCIKQKADWCFKWINDQESSFAQRLIAFAIVEGVFFSGAFCSIFWLKERGKMPGLCFSNELISRDESMHVEFAVHLYSMIKHRVQKETVHDMFKEAVEVEKNFIIDSIPCAMLGMNADLMSTYIEFVADRLLKQLDYEPIYNSHNPFPFMERISIETKSNFFENRVAEYSKANVGGNVEHDKIHEFTLDADF